MTTIKIQLLKSCNGILCSLAGDEGSGEGNSKDEAIQYAILGEK